MKATVSHKALAAAAGPAKPAHDKRITAANVRDICGGVSDMTLWRWLNDPKLGFPRPTYIGRRRYWREAEILRWLDRQSEEAA